MDDSHISADEVEALLDEKLLVEATCQAVERIQFNEDLAQRITTAFNRLNDRQRRSTAIIPEIQDALREIKLDLELVKRTLVSLGHTGVLRREHIEAELVREVFPPSQPRPALGVVTVPEQAVSSKQVDCASRVHLCKAACCRIFTIHLTAREVQSNKYRWNPKQPYTLVRNRHGCSHLKAGTCDCLLYTDRPQTCRTYSCREDKRIWQDFDRMILNSKLEEQLKGLDVLTGRGVDARPMRADADSSLHSDGPNDLNMDNTAVAPRDGEALRQSGDSEDSDPCVGAESPPDFSELRNLIATTPPRMRFVPGAREEAGEASAEGQETAPSGDTPPNIHCGIQ